jgi:RNA polymerase sigma factor (sigma-70 family)
MQTQHVSNLELGASSVKSMLSDGLPQDLTESSAAPHEFALAELAALELPDAALVTSAGEQHSAMLARLVHTIKEGGQAAERAFAALYDATVDRVVSVARRVTRDEHAALDVAEETFVQAWRDAHRFDSSRGSVLAWLLVIARSRALDWYRRRQASPVHYDTDLVEAAAAPLDDASSDPLELISQTDEKCAVHAALAALGGRAKQMVALAFLRGLTHSEIADITGQPLGTVKTTIRRALQDMKTMLSRSEPHLVAQYTNHATKDDLAR